MARPLEEKEPHAAGKKVYNANGCLRCHTMGEAQNGPPGGPKGGPPKGGPPMPPGGDKKKGPDLSKVASKPGRNVEWFIAFVSDPKKDNPESPMPAFAKQIKTEDMRALAEFLADLK
jgi:cbb3-type cytochrome oxidase cytochrome c subunit